MNMLVAWAKAKWWIWRGRRRAKRKDYASANSHFQRSLELFPRNVYALCYAGHCLDLQGNSVEAVKMFDRALQVRPDCAYAHAQLGCIFLASNRPQEATESFARAFRIDPKQETEPSYQLLLARSLANLGRLDAALSAYHRAADLNPADDQALVGAGWMLYKLGKFEEAEQPLRAAIKLKSDYASAYEVLGCTLREMHRAAESIPIWQKLISLEPENADAIANLGWALGDVGRHRDAIPALKHAQEIDPNLYLDHAIGQYHNRLQEYREAVAAEERAILQRPDDADAYGELTAALVGLNEYDQAIVAAQRAVKLNPAVQETWHNLGLAYFETSRFEEAEASLIQVLQLGPGIPDTHLVLGQTYLKLGKSSAALEQCRMLQLLDHDKGKELRDEISSVIP